MRTFNQDQFTVFDERLDLEPTIYLCADASELGIKPGEVFTDRIWFGPDACDEAIYLGGRGREQSSWYLADTTLNQAGDVTHWDFLPTPFTARHWPEFQGRCVRIYND